MNEASTPIWSRSMSGHHDPMVSAPEDDFATFLDLGDFQLNFPPFDVAGQQEALQHDVNNSMDMSYSDGGVTGNENHPHQQGQDPGHHQLHSALRMQIMDHSSAEAAMGLNAQMEYLQQQQHHMQEQEHRRQSIIPPTPNSIEMHGGVSAARYYQQIDPQSLAFIERYQRLKEDQMVFTPLVSPAVTPLENSFIVPEYTVPGAYFSPLTSPALEAQNRTHGSYSNLSQYDSSLATSPEMSVDLPTSSVSTNSNSAQTRKTRRRLSTTRKPSARVVHQSPSMKPQTRRKAPPNAINSTKAFNEATEDPSKTGESMISPRRTPRSLPLPYGQDSSEAGSISPEPLSEALMAPPPPPGSTGRSPSINPKHKSASLIGSIQLDGSTGPAPATPASLMKLPNLPMQGTTDDSQKNGDFLNGRAVEPLPDAGRKSIGTRPSLPRLNTRRADDQTTPTLGATTKTPIVGAMSTPSTRDHSPNQPGSATPNGVVANKPVDTKSSGRGSKKRVSASVQVSPALRPKISPSIKPLLPEGLSAETSALLLASKSNYQNIVEGNNLPGLSYPETLSTNLTSKRTSHKIAEQGRRNRINNALTEIANLLPKDSSSGKEGGGGSGGEASGSNIGGGGSSSGGGGGGAQANSKASTVEMAIDYIKSLQRELQETRGKLEAAEKKLGEKL